MFNLTKNLLVAQTDSHAVSLQCIAIWCHCEEWQYWLNWKGTQSDTIVRSLSVHFLPSAWLLALPSCAGTPTHCRMSHYNNLNVSRWVHLVDEAMLRSDSNLSYDTIRPAGQYKLDSKTFKLPLCLSWSSQELFYSRNCGKRELWQHGAMARKVERIWNT